MNIETAKMLAGVLFAAIEEAEKSGNEEIALGDRLQALDDSARAELEAAIKKAEGG